MRANAEILDGWGTLGGSLITTTPTHHWECGKEKKMLFPLLKKWTGWGTI